MLGLGGKGSGYGYAHRISYLINKGNIKKGLLICHHCDNPPCVNPDHLFQDTCKGNNNDARAKGRHAHGKTHGSKTKPECFARGERIAQHKLSSIEVIKIREMFKSGKYTQRELGKMFKVHPRYTWLIVRNKTWKHLL